MPNGFVVKPGYRVRGGRPVVQLFGRLEDGRPFLVEEKRYRPYFFVRAEHRAVVAGVAPKAVDLDPTELSDLSGAPVLRITVPLPADIPPLRDRLRGEGIASFEADIRFPYRFLIDRGVRGGVRIEGAGRESASGLVTFENPELGPAAVQPTLRVVSLDFETDPSAQRIHAAALVGDDCDEVHLVYDRPVRDAVVHADEPALLRALAERVRALDPDAIVGWNVVDFDLRVWARRCEAHGLPLEIGREAGRIAFLQDRGFTRQSRADVPGRMVLDGIPLVRDAVRLEDYRLETVSQALLGRGKKIDQAAPDAAAEIDRLYREDPEALVAYNREDAQLVLDILAQEGLLALTVERSLLSGMQLDRVGGSIASFDLVYLPELRRRGAVAPSVVPDREPAGVKGGALLEPVPGLHETVAVYDFRSLYPSLIRTFQLDPLAHARARDDAVVAPNGARFARNGAILPAVIERFMARRAEAKRRGDRHADQAIKIMMNALFGVLGAPSCRFFDPAIANAITAFGQQTLGWTRDAFEAEGVRVVYGDTDSVFVQLAEKEGDVRARAEALRATVEDRICRRVADEYGVAPQLELELERVFERLFLPRVRGGGGGSKKRYAGRVDGALVIVGLESVRRDWPRVARRLQEGMLERMFADAPVMPFVREVVEQVRAGALDAELVYVKRIRKGALDRYTATTPPHVQAARKLGEQAGPVIHYVIADTGPEPVLPGRPPPAGIDRRHYVEKVLRPIADAILPELGQSFDEALGNPSQMSLL